MKITERARQITPFYVMELLERARAMEASGEDVVHMEVGEPDFPPPPHIKQSAARAIQDNRTFYTHSLGLSELRASIANNYRVTEGIDLSPERIIVTSGTSSALLLLFGTLLERGSLLAVSDPGYPCYKNIAHFVDAHTLQLPVSAASLYQITVEQLKLLETSPDMLVVANPANPTGTIYDTKSLGALSEYLLEKNAFLVVDEIYSGLSYGEPPRSALSFSDKVIVINGFSKTFAMTGFRLGWMVVPEDLMRPLQKCAQNLFISPPSISQYAALSAFDSPEALETMRLTYQQRRDYLVPRLKNLGFSVPLVPDGAFYIYAGIGKWGLDSMEFVDRALAEAKVAITPGYDFGAFEAASHVRFSYATGLERLALGCNRLESWLERL